MTLRDAVGCFLYPRHCACPLCGRESILGADGLCGECRPLIRFAQPRACPLPLDGLAAALLYEEPVRSAMHAFKYRQRTHYASFFAQYMVPPEHWRYDCYVPVPMHWLKRNLRVYNQSEVLAKALAAFYPAPVERHLLRKTRYTRAQAQTKRDDRSANVQRSFASTQQATGKSVVLIDDVCTTGATLAACADALKEAGVRRVYALCACSAAVPTDQPGDQPFSRSPLYLR